MFSLLTHKSLLAASLTLGLLSGCARTQSASVANRTAPLTLALPLPIVSYIVTQPDGSTLPPSASLATAEASQLHNTMHTWLLRYGHKTRVAITETEKPAAQSDAAWARVLAASEHSDAVLVTRLYHQRVFYSTGSQQVQAVAAQGQVPATIVTVPTASGFTEELSIDVTLYRATGEVIWKRSDRAKPGYFRSGAGQITDHLAKQALQAMPAPRKSGW